MPSKVYIVVFKYTLLTCIRSVRNEVKDKILAIKQKHPQFDPHLAMIQVGGREDSSIYVKMKDKAAKEVHVLIGFISFLLKKTPWIRLVSQSLWKSYPRVSLKLSF